MSRAGIEDVISQALQMPEEERAAIAERLISSLDPAPEADVEQAWQEEVQRRVRDLDNGAVECVPWEEVRRLLDKAR